MPDLVICPACSWRVPKAKSCNHCNASLVSAWAAASTEPGPIVREKSAPPTPSLPRSIACPVCGSSDLRRITAKRKVGKLFLFAPSVLADVGKAWQCRNCHVKF